MKRLPLFRLAWRNVWRNRRRTLIATAALAVAATALVWFRAMGDGMMDDVINSNTSNGTGHVVVQPVGFDKNPLIEKYLHNPQLLVDELESNPLVKAYAPRVEAKGLASSPENSMGATIYGIDPTLEMSVSAFHTVITKGSYFSDVEDTGIIVGSKMAEVLNVEVGDLVAVHIQNLEGEVAAEAYEVKGIMHTGFTSLDNNLVLLPLPLVQKQVGYEGTYTKLVVIARDSNKLPELKSSVDAGISDKAVEVKTWEEISPAGYQMSQMVNASMVFFTLLLIVLCSFSMINTILMTVLERIREFGMMSALGIRPFQLFRLIIYESVIIALFGTIAGLSLGGTLSYINSIYGIDVSSVSSGGKFMGIFSPVIIFHIKPGAFILAATMVFSTAVISAIYPALKTAKLKPIDAIRHV